jgi:hypothetical protein
MIVCLGASKNQVPLIKTSEKCGYKAIATDRDSTPPGIDYALQR